MRKSIVVVVMVAGLALVAPADAQIINSGQASGFFTGVNPRRINFEPIDVSRAMQTRDVTRAYRDVQGNRPFSLRRFFPRLTLGTWPPRIPFAPIFNNNQNPIQTPNTK